MSALFSFPIRFFLRAAPLVALPCILAASCVAEDPTALRAASGVVAVPAPTSSIASAAGSRTSVEGSAASSSASDALPNAPDAAATAAPAADAFFANTSTGGTAPKYAESIPSGWSAQPLSAGNKVVLGFRNIASPTAVAGVIIGAGYSHITDGQPNYGVDGDAFAQRFGAGMARSASQSIFTTSILSPILHQDTRYYVLGSDANFFHRVIYAATRPIIGRTDGGHATINASLLIGYAGAAALTRTYYPGINRNFNDEARTYGASIGGAAIGFAVDEFSDQLLKAFHRKH